MPTNADLAEQFELLADMLELDGADAFRLSAYRRAATRIRESAVPVAQLALDQRATRLSGIGSTIEAKIVEYTETGDLQALAKLRDKLPAGLVDVGPQSPEQYRARRDLDRAVEPEADEGDASRQKSHSDRQQPLQAVVADGDVLEAPAPSHQRLSVLPSDLYNALAHVLVPLPATLAAGR